MAPNLYVRAWSVRWGHMRQQMFNDRPAAHKFHIGLVALAYCFLYRIRYYGHSLALIQLNEQTCWDEDEPLEVVAFNSSNMLQ